MSESQPPAAAWSESSGDIRVSEVDGLPRVAANGGGHSSVDVYDDDSGDVSAPGSMLRAALDLVELGVRVHPMHPILSDGRCASDLLPTSRGKSPCKSAGKHPRLPDWPIEASANPEHVRLWWAETPTANIGIAPGAESGVIVLDIDGADGEASLARLERIYGPLPVTVEARSGRLDGGRHLYFRAPAYRVSKSTGSLGEGLDVIGEGGNIISPPSIHRSGAAYIWVKGRELGAIDLAPFPEWLSPPKPKYEPVTEPRLRSTPSRSPAQAMAYLRGALDGASRELMGAPPKTRNKGLNKVAFDLGLLVAGGEIAADVVRREMFPVAVRVGQGEHEARATIESGLAGAAKPGKTPRHIPDLSPRTNGRSHVQLAPAPSDGASPPKPDAPRIQLVGTDAIFAPLPPMRWVSRDLMIGPGRPTLVAAYGSSAKTLALQSMLLSLSSGHPIWDHFAVPSPVRVCHLDYEQGYRDTYYRYQRLAIGHGIDPRSVGNRLRVGAMPSVYLTSEGAYEDFVRLGDGVQLVLIDSFRASVLGVDENASEVRAYIDMLTRASGETGAAYVLIHHAGKNNDGRDARQLARGSSAIFDACGCVLNLTIGKTGSDPRAVSMSKPPASSEGSSIAPFGLVVQDVAADGNPLAGVSVTWRELPAVDADAEAAAAYERDADRLITAIRANPGATSNTLRVKSGLRRTRVLEVLAALTDEKRLSVSKGPNRAKFYRISEDYS